MDYTLDIILPKQCIEQLGLKQVQHEWGGVMHPQDKYVTSSYIEFYEVEDHEYYNRIVGFLDSDDFLYLYLKSDLLFELEFAVNRDGNQMNNNPLFGFLCKLADLPCFYLILAREDEPVSETIAINDADEMKQVLLECFNWSDPKDVMICKREN